MRHLHSILVVTFLLQACSNNHSSTSNEIKTGQFIDSAVHGLTYITSGDISGTTNSRGEFKYREGELIEFYVGSLNIGSFEGKAIISPFEIGIGNETNRERAKNIIMLLQSLDEDRFPENGLDIRSAVNNDVNDELQKVDLSTPVYEFANNIEWQSLLQRLTGKANFISLPIALDHALSNSSTELSTTSTYLNVVLDASAEAPMVSGTILKTDGSAIGVPQLGSSNGYGEQTILVTLEDGSESQLVLNLNLSAKALAEQFNLIEGINATSTSSASILASSFTNNTNEMNIILNGLSFTPTGLTTELMLTDLGVKINNSHLNDVIATFDVSGNLHIIDKVGANLYFSFSGGESDSYQIVTTESVSAPLTLSSFSPQAVVGGSVDIEVYEGVTLSNMSSTSPIIKGFDGQPFIRNSFHYSRTNTFNHATSTIIFDSLGTPHVLAYYFVKQHPTVNSKNAWHMHILIDDENVGNPLLGSASSLATFNLVFNMDGSLNTLLSDKIIVTNWIPLGDDKLPNGALMPANDKLLPLTFPPSSSNFRVELNAFQLSSKFKVFNNYQNGLTSRNNADLKTQLTGQFIDSPVQGLSYSSGSFSGTTNESGEFYYREKEFVHFHIGELAIGNFQGKEIITPFQSNTTIEDREKSKNITRLLQSLDSDSIPENGIDLREAVTNDLNNELPSITLDSSVNSFESDLNNLAILSKLSNRSTFIPLQKALTHISNEMLSVGLYPPELSTTKVSLNAIVDSRKTPIVKAFDSSDNTSYNHSAEIEIFDSLGLPHRLGIFFTKINETEESWEINFLIDDKYVGDPLIGTSSSKSSLHLALNEEVEKSILVSNWVPLDDLGNPNGARNPKNYLNGGSLPITLNGISSNFEISLVLAATESDFEISEFYQDGFSIN